MEEAFIKVRLLVKDKSELNKAIEDTKERMKGAGSVIGVNAGKELKKQGSSVGEAIANNFGKVMAGGVAMKIAQLLAQDFEKARSMQQKTQNTAEELNTLQKMTGGSISDVMTTQQLLNASGTMNPIGFFSRFTDELNKSRNGESQLLTDYARLNDSQGFNKLMQDLQNFSQEDRNKILEEIWSGIYADNGQRVLTKDIKGITNSSQEIIKKAGGEKNVESAMKNMIEYNTNEKTKDQEAEFDSMMLFNKDNRLDYIAKDNQRRRLSETRAVQDIGNSSTAKEFQDNIGIIMTETAKSFADIMTTGVKNAFEWIKAPSPYSNDNSRYSTGSKK